MAKFYGFENDRNFTIWRQREEGIYSVLYDFSASLPWSFHDFLKFQTVFARFICDEILWLGEIYKSHLNLQSRLNL